MEDLAGTLLKGYQLTAQIGCGSSGTVYRATQMSIEREVAIKVISPEYASRPEFIRRFEADAYRVARLEHPHIAPLYDFWRDPSGAYLVMRFLRGGSIHAVLKNSAYGLNAASLILDQIASALDFAHRHDVIHGNVTPRNVLLDEDGNAYLTDFVIADDLDRPNGSRAAVDTLTRSTDASDPERIHAGIVTPLTDIYALGVTLYELISGDLIVNGNSDSPAERPYKHCGDPLPTITTLPASIRDAVNGIIQKATARNPGDRYPGALTVAAAFRDVTGRSTTTAEVSIVERLTLREQEVLALIADGLSNHEISEALVVSMGTVKWHINQLYKKLGVRGRVQAIVRARELDLIVSADAADDLRPRGTDATLVSAPEPENPYKGLHAFQVEDARDFFGRDDLTQRLIERMRAREPFRHFLAIVGPSGSGKSSVVRAGLVPALWKGALPGSENWFIVDMIPGAHPLDQLDASLKRVAARHAGDLRAQLEQDERGLIRVADTLLPADDTELVITVDQFEEVFTLLDNESERQHFLSLLRAAVSDENSRIRIVVTLRADYYDRPLHYPEFGEMLRSRMETLLPLSVKGLERAIRGPAERVGVTFEQGLVEQIVSSMNHQAGALPLLQYALTELFDRREGRVLTHAAYQQIGGAVGALAARADDIYHDLSAGAQNLTRQMFLRLVTLGEGAEDTRRRAARTELLSLAGDPNQVEEIIDQFAAYRLLALDHDPETRQPTVEVAHEAILRQWDRLRHWLNESRADIRQARALARSAEEWNSHDRDTSYLLRGARLELAEKWLHDTRLVLSMLEREYMVACREQRDRETLVEASRKAREVTLERRSRNWLRALAAVFATAAVIAGLLASETQKNFLRAERIRLAAQSQIALNEGEDARIPALLALRSLTIAYSPEAEAALLNAITRDIPKQVYAGHAGEGLTGVYFSADGTQVLTTGTDGTARLWGTLNGVESRRFSGHTHIVHSAAFMPGGESLLTSGNDGTVRVWDIATGREVARLLEEGTVNLKLALSPDGQRLATSDDDFRIHIWRLDTMERLHTLVGHTDLVSQIAFSPDGRLLATAGFDRSIYVWDAATGEVIHHLVGHAARVFGIAFSPDGSLIASVSDDSTVRLWDVETAAERGRFFGTVGMLSVAFSPDGQTLAAGSLRGNTLTLWNVETGDKLREIHGSTGGSGFVAFSPDGEFILGAGSENVSRLWHVQIDSEPREYFLPTSAIHAEAVILAALIEDEQQLVTVLGEGIVRIWNAASYQVARTFSVAGGGFVTGAVIDAPQHRLLTVSEDGIARLWSLHDGRLLREYQGHAGRINAIALAADYRQFVTGGSDGTVLLWDVDTTVLVRRFDGHDGPVSDVVLSPDNRLVMTVSEDGSTRLWDAQSGVERPGFVSHEGAVRSAAFSPDSRLLVTGGDDNAAMLWNIETGELTKRYIGHT
ncbi:MAG TPA: protein kinase, partial [Aggregatilineales bacterium]|nr:protein kinase [Aggregatilineales bacterium]